MNNRAAQTTAQQHQAISYNWKTVGFLLFLTGIPGLPAIGILALVLIGPDAFEGASSFINENFYQVPAAILWHGGAGIVFAFTMPFQFSSALRVRQPTLHKVSGRIVVLSGCIMALSGVWMHHVVSPDAFGARYASLIVMTVAICVSFIVAISHAISKNLPAHRVWMLRAVAITLAAVTELFIAIPAYLVFGQFENIAILANRILFDYGRLIAIGMNLMIVELLMFRKKAPANSLPARKVYSGRSV
ncbi:DUF2306 domain-containing protein [Alkalimonas sp.]|uniref:DUF2306 domain-containing protein n=1 Tax=Alkalimonas sp. TaxID=1872453 RepID=UPI00263BDEDB|nr:DUF2306 domain-containing protein [Alkalimonas sp.]MCC5825916.1 DUF2306 domain-containing protein [Alkalimonas sp.]